MDGRKTAKIVAIILSLTTFAFIPYKDWYNVGIYEGCRWVNHLTFHFFHAGFIHALMNVWCLLSVVFLYDITLTRFFLMFIVAMSYPINLMAESGFNCQTPTVGLSGIIFALFGSLSFEVKRKLYYQGWMAFYIIIGFLNASSNPWIHVYCYTIGFAIAFINKPYKIDNQ